jgi:hypothetical protein
MAINQAHALEHAAQALALRLQLNYAGTRMIDHYLGNVTTVDPHIVEVVTLANQIMQPLFDAIGDAEIEHNLLTHRLGICRTQFRNLSEYVHAIPGRMPTSKNAHLRGELLAWLQQEIDGAPTLPGGSAQ